MAPRLSITKEILEESIRRHIVEDIQLKELSLELGFEKSYFTCLFKRQGIKSNQRCLTISKGFKQCDVCHRIKRESKFSPRSMRCKECTASRLRDYRASNKEKFQKYEAKRAKTDRRRLQTVGYDLKRKYGITPEQRAEMMDNQKGCCAICKASLINPKFSASDLNVDHNHETGEVRGLLCSKCNTGLGQFKDNKEYLMAAINYLN